MAHLYLVGVLFFLTSSFSVQAEVPNRSQCNFPPSTVVIPADGSKDVVCEHPDGVVRWFKGTTGVGGDGELDSSCSCQSSGNSKKTLRFMNYQKEFDGIYTCALPLGGSVFQECQFDVAILTHPTVIIQDKEAVLSSGEILTITPMVVLGVPTAAITWVHNGSLLNPATDSRVTIDPVSGMLSVRDVRGTDRGLYTITLQNDNAVASDYISIVINFLDEIHPNVRRDGKMIQVTCEVLGYPKVMFTWNPIFSVRTTTESLDNATNVTSTVTLTVPQCLELNKLTCTASNGQGGTMASRVINDLPCYNPPRVESNGITSVRVMWDRVGSSTATYRVRYTDEVLKTVLYSDVVKVPDVIIQGLRAGRAYTFEVATLRSGRFSYIGTSRAFTTGGCPSTTRSLSQAVKDVNAVLDNVGGQRTVRVTWTPSTEDGVTGYRVSITPTKYLMSSDPIVLPSLPSSVLISSRNSYTLDPSICDGVVYSYKVEAVNLCNNGSLPVTVRLKCSNLPIIFSVKKRASNGFMFMVKVQENISSAGIVTIKTSTLTPIENVKVSSIYEGSYPLSGMVCITELTKDTYYNICLITDGRDFPSKEICIQDVTSTDGDDIILLGCLSKKSTTTMTIIDMSRVTFPDWAIAVVVVGVLALVAGIFCFIGICFACSPDQKSEDPYGSVSSLQASSVGAPQHIHRSVSPPRSSCLSYHVKGHSTNWNEHTDTLRQMETDRGTHV